MPLSIYIYKFLKLLPRKQATDDFGVVPAEDLHFAHRIVAEIGEAQKVDCQKLTVGRLAHLRMADAISRFFIFVIVTWQMNLLMIVYTRFITETFVPVFIV